MTKFKVTREIALKLNEYQQALPEKLPQFTIKNRGTNKEELVWPKEYHVYKGHEILFNPDLQYLKEQHQANPLNKPIHPEDRIVGSRNVEVFHNYHRALRKAYEKEGWKGVNAYMNKILSLVKTYKYHMTKDGDKTINSNKEK